MALLTVNTGSSSLKFAVYDNEANRREKTVSVERIGAPETLLQITQSSPIQVVAQNHRGAIDQVLTRLPELLRSTVRAIGHRLVHGGADHHEPKFITSSLIDELKQLRDIDPTHTPQAVGVIEGLMERFPGVPQIACFDTGFHRSMPAVAQWYPLPRWTIETGVRRYGFHGLSCESIVSQLQHMGAGGGRLLIAHLGNGGSVTAVRNGTSVDTSMGFSPTGGLMMGTRSGDLDPTVITYIARKRTLDTNAVDRLVNEQSGLLGFSRVSRDMRDVLRAAASNAEAAEAIDLYCYIARKHFAALIAVLEGVDTIVFTGGIGENAAPVRENICAGLQHLGVQLDRQRNRTNNPVISNESSGVVVRVIHTDEELVIAKHVARLLGERRK
jgi:acetate kinase